MTPAEAHAQLEIIRGGYHALFNSPTGKQVLSDLTAYCHGRKTTFDENDRRHAFNEGKRDVLMRIVEFANLSLEEIYHLRNAPLPRSVPQPGDD
jgi:hypothetical protein